jgi:hypothetical protein
VSQTFSLLVIIPSLANMGLIDVEVENTKRKIKTICKKQIIPTTKNAQARMGFT